MIEFTASVRDWLESDPKNVIAVHCKGKTVIFPFNGKFKCKIIHE